MLHSISETKLVLCKYRCLLSLILHFDHSHIQKGKLRTDEIGEANEAVDFTTFFGRIVSHAQTGDVYIIVGQTPSQNAKIRLPVAAQRTQVLPVVPTHSHR